MDQALDLTHRDWLGRGDAGPAHRECDQRHGGHGHSLHYGALVLNQGTGRDTSIGSTAYRVPDEPAMSSGGLSYTRAVKPIPIVVALLMATASPKAQTPEKIRVVV